jgi:hypothetical protein
MKRPSQNRFILLPAAQLESSAETSPKVANFLTSLSARQHEPAVSLSSRSAGRGAPLSLKVIDSIHEAGAKLVEFDESEMSDLHFSYPGLRIVREKFYRLASVPRLVAHRAPKKKALRAASGVILRKAARKQKKAAARAILRLIITDKSGKPIAGVRAVAFTDFAGRVGANGTSTRSGKISLSLSGARVERLYVYPEHSYWGYFKKNFNASSTLALRLESIDLKYKDALRHFYDTSALPKLAGRVRVGVIDTGVGPHRDLVVTGGLNTVAGEKPEDFVDNGEGHGTHVAGIIGASGGLNGVAAGVEIFSYRVFPKEGGASNFSIMKAIDRAIRDKCDLINMSLGESGTDEGIMSSIKEAYHKGTLCIAANGNDDRAPVNFPASYSLCVAISAMGRKGTFPANTVQTSIVSSPFGTDKQNFIADFSCIGPETDLTAPGVGIMSTFPNDLYAIMDGTSMACPAATGMAARVLAGKPSVLAMPRNESRSNEMMKVLASHARKMGFGADYEGQGMLFS